MSPLRTASLLGVVVSLLGCGEAPATTDLGRYVTRDELDARLAAQERALRAAFHEALVQRPAAPDATMPLAVIPAPAVGASVPPAAAPPARSQPVVDVARELAAIEAARAARGVAWDDVPALAELVAMGKRAAAEGDAPRARLMLTDVQNGLVELQIDRAFVQGKYKRAADAVRRKKPDGAVRVEVDRLFTEATEHVSEGRLPQAHAALNKIHALVDPLPDPG